MIPVDGIEGGRLAIVMSPLRATTPALLDDARTGATSAGLSVAVVFDLAAIGFPAETEDPHARS